MKFKLIVLVFLCAAFSILQPIRAQIHLSPSPNQAAHATDSLNPIGANGLRDEKMVVIRPSRGPSQLITNPNQIAPTLSIRRLPSARPTPDNVSLFEIENSGSTDALNVSIDLSLESPGAIKNTVPKTTIFATRRVKFRFPKLPARTVKLIQVETDADDSPFANFKAKINVESVHSFTCSPENNDQNDHRLSGTPQAITAKVTGPHLLQLGNEADFAVKITNSGEYPMSDIRVSMVVPRGLEITILDRVSDPDLGRRTIQWDVPVLDVNKSELIQFRAKAILAGQQDLSVDVTIGDHVVRGETLTTKVVGDSNPLQLTIQDFDRTLRVGEMVFVEIIINNPDDRSNNFRLAIYLPEGLRVLDADSTGIADSKSVVFDQTILASGAEKRVILQVVADTAGQKSIRASIFSDTTETPNSVARKITFLPLQDARNNAADQIQIPK